MKAGYKTTKVGLIPEDWDGIALGELGSPVRGASPRPAGDPRYFNGSYIPWLTVAAMTNIPAETLEVTTTASFLTEEGARHSRTLVPGTLLIANSGATLGIAKILGIKCCANDGIAAILNLRKDVSARYLAHCINAKTSYLRAVVASGNGQPNLNTERIGRFRVPLPPTAAEQEAIAAALGDADALIESLEQLLAKKRQIKQGAMEQLLTGKRRLPGFNDEWPIEALGEFGHFLKGSGIAKTESLSGVIPSVRYGEIYTRHDDYIKEFYSWISPTVAASAMRLEKGDVLFAGSGETKDEIGKCVAFTSDVEAYAGSDIVIFRPSHTNPLFLGYYLNSSPIARQKAARGQGDAVVHISASALANIVVKMPSVIEQTAIVAVLSDMDAEITALKAKLTKTRQLKVGMMQQLLTGRIRLV